MCAHHLSRLLDPRHRAQRRKIFLQLVAHARRTGLVLLVLLRSRCAAATPLRRVAATHLYFTRVAHARLAERAVMAGAARCAELVTRVVARAAVKRASATRRRVMVVAHGAPATLRACSLVGLRGLGGGGRPRRAPRAVARPAVPGAPRDGYHRRDLGAAGRALAAVGAGSVCGPDSAACGVL